MLALVNVGEDQLDDIDAVDRARSRPSWRAAAEVIGMCVQLEAEAAQLDADERAEMLEGLGLGEGALPDVPARRLPAARPAHLPHDRREGVAGLDVPRRLQGARSAPGVIHTDFERGFIRAEVIHWDELLELGSWTKARDVGKLRVEGKDYEVADGDVLEIRFNV